MIKIALVTPILQHYRLTFYEKLSKADPDFDLTVFYGCSKVDNGRPSYTGTTNFVSKSFKEYKLRILPFDLVYNKGMFREVKELNPDVVIVQGIAGDITNRMILRWARHRKKKIIIWACGWDPGRAHGIFLKLKNKFVRTFFKKADYFLTYSTKASKYIKGFGFPDSIIETCYNGIEIDGMILQQEDILLKAQKIRTELGLGQNISFIYVGGLIREKRIDLLIRAFSLLRQKYDNIKLIIIGDGPFRNEMELLISNASDNNMIYLGRIIQDVDAYFAASDCLVLPGIGGLALNQAMFWKKTCVVSQADGTEDDLVIDGYSGYRFSSDDLLSLAGALERRIMEKPEAVKQMSENAYRIIIEKSNVNNMVNHFAGAIYKLMNSY